MGVLDCSGCKFAMAPNDAKPNCCRAQQAMDNNRQHFTRTGFSVILTAVDAPNFAEYVQSYCRDMPAESLLDNLNPLLQQTVSNVFDAHPSHRIFSVGMFLAAVADAKLMHTHDIERIVYTVHQIVWDLGRIGGTPVAYRAASEAE